MPPPCVAALRVLLDFDIGILPFELPFERRCRLGNYLANANVRESSRLGNKSVMIC